MIISMRARIESQSNQDQRETTRGRAAEKHWSKYNDDYNEQNSDQVQVVASSQVHSTKGCDHSFALSETDVSGLHLFQVLASVLCVITLACVSFIAYFVRLIWSETRGREFGEKPVPVSNKKWGHSLLSQEMTEKWCNVPVNENVLFLHHLWDVCRNKDTLIMCVLPSHGPLLSPINVLIMTQYMSETLTFDLLGSRWNVHG